MISVSFRILTICITILWVLVRLYFCFQRHSICWKREVQLLLVYICIMVVTRFTFFPFSKVNGQIQPLIFDINRAIPFRINLIPFVNLTDYPDPREIALNIAGNTAMFIPIGVIWPAVYKELNTHNRVLSAGFGFSLCIELLQLPFFDRVSDVDDLILNSLGFAIGYGLYLIVRKCNLSVKKTIR